LRRAGRSWQLETLAAKADALLTSYPKAGRTWLRTILANTINEHFGLGVQIDLNTVFHIVPNRDLSPERGLKAWRFGERPGVPLVTVTHETYKRSWPAKLPIVHIVRDPRDLMVSAYFHHTRHKHRFEGTPAELIHHHSLGINDFIAYTNGFAEGLPRHRHLVLSYEGLSVDPKRVAGEVLRFIGLQVRDEILERALAASSFEAMRDAELQTGIPGHDYDRSDSDSLRVRKGIVGGYGETLEPADIAFIESRCREYLTPGAKALLRGTGFPV
jgi:alcohol sulfotransferase